ncbi:MAG: hypothetical protein HY801_04655, partial [Candidatus Lindowbacteria bacterium]|nr:hypothetical protein [Candidatus Lindowbacteria bacterium]
MPGKVLGKDPFERSKSPAKSQAEKEKADAAAGDIRSPEIGESGKAATAKRIKLLEPSKKPAKPAAAEKIIEKKIEKRITEFENRLGELLQGTEEVDKGVKSKKQRASQPAKAEEEALSSSSEGESSASSEESADSDSAENSSAPEESEGLLGQLLS